MTELRYWTGDADGDFGASTQMGVVALQKAAGLERDGVVGPRTAAALAAGIRPTARTGSGRVVEIDLSHQLLMLVSDGVVQWVFDTSTGGGYRYEQEGHWYLAITPTGSFTVTRQLDGWDHSKLGWLWRPKYFNGGIAIHGYAEVPPYPASHGCVRIGIDAMNWVWTHHLVPIGTRVVVYR